MTKRLEPVACPKCGNTTEQEGIAYCYLEWRIMPVAGAQGNVVKIEFNFNEGADLGDERAWAENTPDDEKDCSHFHCNACGWNWHDPRPRD